MNPQRDLLSPLQVLLLVSLESSNYYHLNKHSLENIEKFFNTWCKTQAKILKSSLCPQSTPFSCLHHNTLEMSLISQDVSHFQAKKLPVMQVHGRAEIFCCLFPVKFQGASFTTGEMC